VVASRLDGTQRSGISCISITRASVTYLPIPPSSVLRILVEVEAKRRSRALAPYRCWSCFLRPRSSRQEK
jgi:hypothetical protein